MHKDVYWAQSKVWPKVQCLQHTGTHIPLTQGNVVTQGREELGRCSGASSALRISHLGSLNWPMTLTPQKLDTQVLSGHTRHDSLA